MRHTLPTLALLFAASSILSASTWTGAGDGISWSDVANWANNSPPSADDQVWDIPAGLSVTLDGAAPGGHIIKQGAGTLLWSSTASAVSMDVLDGTFDFSGERITTAIHLSGGTATGYFLEAPIIATGGTLSSYIWAPLTLSGGPVVCDSVYAGYGIMLEGATVRGYLTAESGIWFGASTEPSRIEGCLDLSAGSSLSWSMQDSLDVTPLIVTGQITTYYSEIWLYFGLVDWSNPYWSTQRDYLFVDAQEGGIVAANLIPDPYAGNEAWGTWSRVPTEDGDIVLRWTPLTEVAYASTPIPEASTAMWVLAMMAGAIAGRIARRRSRQN